MKPLFWQEILEALEKEPVTVPREDASVEPPVPDHMPAEAGPHALEDAVAMTEDAVAEAAPRRRLIDDPKKLVVFSEIMKPKFDD